MIMPYSPGIFNVDGEVVKYTCDAILLEVVPQAYRMLVPAPNATPCAELARYPIAAVAAEKEEVEAVVEEVEAAAQEEAPVDAGAAEKVTESEVAEAPAAEVEAEVEAEAVVEAEVESKVEAAAEAEVVAEVEAVEAASAAEPGSPAAASQGN